VKRREFNIIILALFHLLVFITPFAIKDMHHHETSSLDITYQADYGTVLSKAEKPCPVCQFEFFNFISDDPITNWICRPVCLVKNCTSVQQVHTIPFSSYLLRAPPLA
jgi:hypothetical protein